MLYQVTHLELDYDSDNFPTAEEEADIVDSVKFALWEGDDEFEVVDSISDFTGWCVRNVRVVPVDQL